MNQTIQFLETIIEQGTQLQNDLWTNQSIRLINKVAIFVAILTIPYVILTYILGLYIATIVDCIAIFNYFIIYFINANARFKISRIILLVQGNLHILAISLILGTESGIHHYLYAAVIAPLFFFREEEFKQIIGFCLFSIFLGMCYPFISDLYSPYSANKDTIKFFFHIPTISGVFIAVLGFILYFYNESFRTQKILDDQNKQLQFIGETDHLTQIGNRRKLESVIRMEWSRGLRKKYTVCVILIDVDSFKLYNDIYGHLAGDECLRSIAKTLKTEIRTDFDFIARFGGEEFIVILHDTDLENAKVVASRMQSAVFNLNILHTKNLEYGRVTISMGIACAIPTLDRSPLELIDEADQYLYEAKTSGKNKFIAQAN
ncbi:MAG TPA: diguanylate cyclase [Leptospiraceae bacterium]|nr:diguanylate cyclase [Leptospiraceae bacterium]HMW08436.1 diguanylate cyclase [Leptospiraceae bacterium]HMY34263.1 diguanylate cyclase [Leptospiraceae bacterium]HMZ67240.1 diguanylate cyclase [Leptospiraceae bacterium]HNA10010.1 diguanylate cyclase [Leptospiraceae bacterium]